MSSTNVNTITDTQLTESNLVSKDVTSTPKGGTKRLLTPSPANLSSEQSLFKRTRQISGETELLFESEAEPELEESIGMATEKYKGDEVFHMGSDDIIKVALKLKEVMFPEIKEMIKEQIRDEIPAVVNTAVKEATKTLKDEISHLKTENSSLKKENSNLKKSVDSLRSAEKKVELLADNNEQYSRRNSLRITGIPIEANESTDEQVLDLATDMGVDLHLSEIDRSHRVGQLQNGQRALIVKFTSYRARQELFSLRKNLRYHDTRKNVFINEDLTSQRSKLLSEARKLVRERRLRAAYTGDGKIFIKDNENARHFITTKDQLREYSTVEPRQDSEDEDENNA